MSVLPITASADGASFEIPKVEFLYEAWVDCAPLRSLGQGPLGERRMVPILGGHFAGPRLKGVVLAGGADRQLIRPDGVHLLNAVYEMQTDDDAVLSVSNRVTIDRRDASAPYARSSVEITAPQGPYGWLNDRVFVGTLTPQPPERHAVVIRVFTVV